MAEQALPWVISADDHVVEPPDLWERWLPAQYRDRGPRVEAHPWEARVRPDGGKDQVIATEGPVTDFWVCEDTVRAIPMVMACAGYGEDEFTLDPIRFSDMRKGCYDPQARLADMDEGRIERSLNFPNYARFAGQHFLSVNDKDLALACVQAYNDWMIDEWCADSGGRLIPLGIIPMWDAHASAAEVRRNAARGQQAITFSELPTNLGLPSLHDADRYWDPLLQACDETSTVLCMHIGSSSMVPKTSPDSPQAMSNALTSMNAYMSMADWLLSGALIRFPNLKIAFSESQIGWIPFLLERLDRTFTHSASWGNLPPEITEPPSTQVPGRVYGTFFDDMVGVDLREKIGVGQIMFETDYPHQDTTWPNTPNLVAEIGKRCSADDLERIMRTNAIECFGLEPGDLRPEHLRG